MTPDEARDLLDGTTPGPWEWVDGKDNGVEYEALRGPGGVDALRTQDAEEYASWIVGTNANKALAAAAPTLAALIARLRPEYRAEEWQGSCPGWVPTSPWTVVKPEGSTDPNTRVVRRYVTTEEEI